MVDRKVYTLRGWLAFVAFLDFAQCIRSWRDTDSYLGSFMCSSNCSDSLKVAVPLSTARLLTVYSFQNCFVMTISALCIHHWPVILMAAVSIILKISHLLMESLKFHSAPFDFHIIFPIITHGLTLMILCFSPWILHGEMTPEEENEQLAKMCNKQPMYFPPAKKKTQ